MNKASSGSLPLHNNDNTNAKNHTAAPKWKTLLRKLHPAPFEKWRKPLKTGLAFLIGITMTLSNKCREAIGQGTLLICIVLVFYSPSRPTGVVFEVICLLNITSIFAKINCN